MDRLVGAMNNKNNNDNMGELSEMNKVYYFSK